MNPNEFAYKPGEYWVKESLIVKGGWNVMFEEAGIDTYPYYHIALDVAFALNQAREQRLRQGK